MRMARYALVGAVVAAFGTVFGLVGTGALGGPGRSSLAATSSADPASTYVVARRNLSAQTEVSATLGYAGTYSVVNQAGPGTTSATYTGLPDVGTVVSEGQVLYEVSGAPVILLYGTVPMYRPLSEGMSGPDVEQLNADLVALGYASRSSLDPASTYFSSETAAALKRLQSHLGVSRTGTLGFGQAVFLPSPARVVSVSATLGGPAEPGATVLQATSTRRQVSIALDASERSEVAVGEPVSVTLPNGSTTPGVIASVGTVATVPSSGQGGQGGTASAGGSGSSSAPTVTVLVKPTDPSATGDWDQAPVSVTITTGSVNNVLVVPVVALLAQPGSEYAVELVGPGGARQLVDVSLGLFDDADGLVQVSGSGLEAGQRVVVPNI